MDKAVPTIQQSITRSQGLPVGAVMTEAKRLARNAVREQRRAQGLKVAWIEHSKLVEAANAYLDAHKAELVSRGVANLTNYVQRRKR